MARIRTIKPEFWTSAQIMECSTNARLMFIGMWNFADDHGRMTFSAKTIKAQIFPADDISTETVQGMLSELSTNGLIRVYVVDGKEYLIISGWHHQRIDKPQKPKYPDPPPEHSPNSPGTFVAVSTPILEEKEKEKEKEPTDAAPEARAPMLDEETECYRRGKQVCGQNSGGLIKNLIQAKGGKIALARAVIETASTKQNPREYLSGAVKGRERDAKEDLRERGEAW